jgi:S1-C subfamily serine protease
VGITRVADVNEDTVPGPAGPPGVLVVELLRGSSADRGGLEPGDVVIAVDGRAIESAAQLRNELARAAVGSRLKLTVARGRRQLEITVSVEESASGA